MERGLLALVRNEPRKGSRSGSGSLSAPVQGVHHFRYRTIGRANLLALHSELLQHPLRADIVNIGQCPDTGELKGIERPVNHGLSGFKGQSLSPPCPTDRVADHRTSVRGINLEIDGADQHSLEYHREGRGPIPRFGHVDGDEGFGIFPRKGLGNMGQKPSKLPVVSIRLRCLKVADFKGPKQQPLGMNVRQTAHLNQFNMGSLNEVSQTSEQKRMILRGWLFMTTYELWK